MRTTLDLDPSVLAAARQFALHRAISLGKAVSELVSKGLGQAAALPAGDETLPKFYSRPDAPIITLEDVKRCLDDEV